MKRGAMLGASVGLLLAMPMLPFISSPPASANVTNESSLTISHFKITSSNGQFIELYNNTDQPIDMSTVQMAYYNNYDLTKATSSKQISLSGVLPPKSYFLVNDSALTLCYQMIVSSQSLGFSSTAGMVQILRLTQASPGAPVTNQLIDYIAWSKTAANGAQTLPASTNAFLQRRWAEGSVKSVGGGTWLIVQPSVSNPCELESVTTASIPTQHQAGLLPPVLPTVKFVTMLPATEATVDYNKGLMAPVINELLANPASPQTDADDEFVELYNPNDSNFNLSNFALAFGSTNPKKYNFPENTVLPPKSFVAFTSADTSLSLSNELAQVWLLDQNGGVVSQTEPYNKPKEGQSWALANGAWTWSLQPTPNAENIIATAVTSTDAVSSGAVLGISTNALSDGAQTVASANPTTTTALNDAAPLHPLVLAGVGTSALGYAVYEYRHDMGNRLFQFRRYLRNRRTLRP